MISSGDTASILSVVSYGFPLVYLSSFPENQVAEEGVHFVPRSPTWIAPITSLTNFNGNIL